MSKFLATITDIKSSDTLNIVTFNAESISLKMISLELDTNMKVGAQVELSCKAISVGIAKNFTGELSYSNQLDLEIVSIDEGLLLSNLKLSKGNFCLDSIITSSSLKKMDLRRGEHITALIKSSELSITKLL